MTCTGPLELVTASLGRVVTLAQAKTHCRVDQDITIDDGYLGDLIDGAQEYFEGCIDGERQLMAATYDLPVEGWWDDQLPLPRPPLLAIPQILYRDSDDASNTLSSSVYLVKTPWRQPGYVELAPSQDWPTNISSERTYPITVRFLAGYGAAMTAAVSNVITVTGRRFTAGDVVRFATTTTLPAGLDAYTDYYVKSVSGATFEVSTTSGGTSVDITDTGTGSHFVMVPPRQARQAVLLLVSHWYASRSPVVIGSISKALEHTIESLASQLLWGAYN